MRNTRDANWNSGPTTMPAHRNPHSGTTSKYEGAARKMVEQRDCLLLHDSVALNADVTELELRRLIRYPLVIVQV